MEKAQRFSEATEILHKKALDLNASVELMSNIKNWCFVHTTKYLPKRNTNGDLYIATSAMAKRFETLRPTVHATLNHIVSDHGYGSWSDAQFVILAPYNDIVTKNGNPVEVSAVDTYWSLSPDKGLILPETTYIIKPDNNGPLFQIGEHGATYKRDNYTEEEIAQIESFIPEQEKDEYECYKTGKISEFEKHTIDIGGYGPLVKKMYENTKDKEAFCRGLFEEKRFEILSKHLRNMVTKLSMQEIGKCWVNNVGSEILATVEETAEKNKLFGCAHNQGHAASVYYRLESFEAFLLGILKTHDIESFNKVDKDISNWANYSVLDYLINNTIDFLKLYEDQYKRFREDLIFSYSGPLENIYFKKIVKNKTIKEYDENLWESIQKQCKEYLEPKYRLWRDEFRNKPENSAFLGKKSNITYDMNEHISR